MATLFLSFLVLFGLAASLYLLFRNKVKYSLSMANKTTLLISAGLTSLLFIHDEIYDQPSVPYTIMEKMMEVIVVGTAYTLIIYLLLTGMRYLFSLVRV